MVGWAKINAEIHERRVDLPSLPTALIGRDHVVNQLAHRLAGHQGRLLTFVGAPGVGKTTLALAVAARVQAFYANGAIFVSLAPIADAALMAVAVLVAAGAGDTGDTGDVGDTGVSGARSPQSRLIGFLRRKTMLLVLDNLEQVDGAAGLISSLLAECPGLCVLATSRERLHLRAEQRCKVLPLDRAAALELFVQRAQVVAVDFHLTPHNRPILEAICQRLDCLPLALELCAAQIDLLSPAQLLAHLRTHPLDVLVDGAHDLPPRQRTLRSAILHSYVLLQEDEQRLLRSVGVFAGGFVLAEVSALMAERPAMDSSGAEHVQRTLHTLIGNNLVRSETTPDGESRFSLLETIRAFALEQLRMEGEEAQLHQVHHAVYLRLFRTGDRHLRGPDAPAWMARLQPERGNLRAALQWALDGAHYGDAASLMVAISFFWGLSGDAYEETRWLAQLLPHRHALAPDLHLACLLTFHRAASTMQEFPAMDRWTEEVMALLPLCEASSSMPLPGRCSPEQWLILSRQPQPGSGALPWRAPPVKTQRQSWNMVRSAIKTLFLVPISSGMQCS
jgi:predicted ATPase